MREIRSSGTVGERGGNEPLYPEGTNYFFRFCKERFDFAVLMLVTKIASNS